MNQAFNLLLVDDDSMDVTLIRRVIEKSGHPIGVTAVSDGEEALTFLRSDKVQHPLIILLDLTMPKMDGLTFLKELRTDPQLKNYIVFVLTGSDDDGSKLTTYHVGIAGYLTKETVGREFEQLVPFLLAYNNSIDYPKLQEDTF